LKQTLGPAHENTLASAHNIGRCLIRQGDYAGAELAFREAYEGRKKAWD
jgi:Flp pilus assembly protein TadD